MYLKRMIEECWKCKPFYNFSVVKVLLRSQAFFSYLSKAYFHNFSFESLCCNFAILWTLVWCWCSWVFVVEFHRHKSLSRTPMLTKRFPALQSTTQDINGIYVPKPSSCTQRHDAWKLLINPKIMVWMSRTSGPYLHKAVCDVRKLWILVKCRITLICNLTD